MSEKITFVPVSIDSTPATSKVEKPQTLLTIRKGKIAVDLYPGVDEQLIRLIMKEMRFQ